MHVARVKGICAECILTSVNAWPPRRDIFINYVLETVFLSAIVEVFRGVVAEDFCHPVTCHIPEERNPPVLAAWMEEVNCMGCYVYGIFQQWYWGTACKGIMTVFLFISLHNSLLFFIYVVLTDSVLTTF